MDKDLNMGLIGSVFTCTNTCILTYTAGKKVCIFVIWTGTCRCICILHVFMYVCTYYHMIIVILIYTYIHASIYTNIFTHTYTYEYTHIYTHVQYYLTVHECKQEYKKILSPVLHYIALGLSYGVPIVMSAEVRRQRIYDNLSLPRIYIDDCLLLCIYTSTPLSPPGHTGGQVCVRPSAICPSPGTQSVIDTATGGCQGPGYEY